MESGCLGEHPQPEALTETAPATSWPRPGVPLLEHPEHLPPHLTVRKWQDHLDRAGRGRA
ncbi:hypothetical protein GCM10009850_075550 [Nonomuraea monospora]|uniref:Uncharacterized protein n=1 Tax=Nonomuraea monospora TaxID=568818 RepID=A0ABN3CS74_9ACTN